MHSNYGLWLQRYGEFYGQQPWIFIATKESVYTIKEFNSHRMASYTNKASVSLFWTQIWLLWRHVKTLMDNGLDIVIVYRFSIFIGGALSRYFEVFWPSTNLPLNWWKPKNNALKRWKNTKEIIIKEQGWLRMEKIDTDYKQQNWKV